MITDEARKLLSEADVCLVRIGALDQARAIRDLLDELTPADDMSLRPRPGETPADVIARVESAAKRSV